MAYNLTALDAANSTLSLVQEVNATTGDWWARLFLIGLALLIFLSVALKTGEALKGMIAGAFSASVVSYLFWASGLTGSIEPIMATIATAALLITIYAGGAGK